MGSDQCLSFESENALDWSISVMMADQDAFILAVLDCVRFLDDVQVKPLRYALP